jgi:hypothetical protein
MFERPFKNIHDVDDEARLAPAAISVASGASYRSL